MKSSRKKSLPQGYIWYLGDKNDYQGGKYGTSEIKMVPWGEKKEYLHPLFKGFYVGMVIVRSQ